MDWPSYSPDLNPMENVWAILKRNVAKRNPETTEDLIEAIHLECRNFSQESGFNIFSSIYDRIDLLIESNDDAIHY